MPVRPGTWTWKRWRACAWRSNVNRRTSWPGSANVTNPFDILPLNLFNLFSTQGCTLQKHYMAILLRIYSLRSSIVRAGARGGESPRSSIICRTSGVEGKWLPKWRCKATSASKLRRLPGRKRTRIMQGISCGGSKAQAGSSASSTPIIARPSRCRIMPLRCWRLSARSRNRNRTSSAGSCTPLTNSSPPPRPIRTFRPLWRLTQAYENVRQLVRGLSELNQNIRRYVERATHEKQIADLLRLQFDDYSLDAGLFLPRVEDLRSRVALPVGYHQSDAAWQMDGEWLENAASELALQSRLDPAPSRADAHRLFAICHPPVGRLDPLLEAIDQRHAQYPAHVAAANPTASWAMPMAVSRTA